jgi:acyl carrier protein
MDDIEETVKAYLLEEFLPGEDPSALDSSTPLVTGGILDSISTLKLVNFLEQRYGIEFQAHEMGVDRLNTLADIAAVVRSKLEAK